MSGCRLSRDAHPPPCDNRRLWSPRSYDVIVDAVIVLVGIALIAFALALLARKAQRGGTAGAALAGAMAAYNEAWHTTAYSTHAEMKSQADRVAGSDSPEDL